MTNKVQFLLFLSALLITQSLQAALYNCRMNSPKGSMFFDRNVKIECDLDSLAKPKFVVLSGSSKVPLNQKAEYIGPDAGGLYERHQMTALDGQIFDLHTASRMFTETAQASFFTIEPGRNSALWVCYIEE